MSWAEPWLEYIRVEYSKLPQEQTQTTTDSHTHIIELMNTELYPNAPRLSKSLWLSTFSNFVLINCQFLELLHSILNTISFSYLLRGQPLFINLISWTTLREKGKRERYICVRKIPQVIHKGIQLVKVHVYVHGQLRNVILHVHYTCTIHVALIKRGGGRRSDICDSLLYIVHTVHVHVV